MAPKKRTTTVQIPVIQNDDELETTAEGIAQSIDDAEELDAAEALLALAEIEGAGEITWSVTRVAAPPGVPLGIVAKLTTAELSLDRLLEFGRGKYKVRGFRPGKGFAGQRTVEIACDPARQQPTAAPAQPASAVQDVLALIKAESDRKSDNLKSWAAILVPALAPMLAQWVTPRRDSLADMVTALQGLKTVAQPEQPFDNFVRLLEVTKDIVGDNKGTGTGSNWVDVVRDAISGVKPMLERLPIVGALPISASQQLPAPAIAHGPAPQPEPATNPSDGATSPEGNPMLWLKGTLQQLIVQAARNRDPSLYAEVVLDNVPPHVNVEDLKRHLSRPDWWTVLVQFVPEVAPYQGWMTEFRRVALELIDEQTNKEPEKDE